MGRKSYFNRAIIEEVGPLLKQLRLEKGLTLEQVQEQIHFSAKLLQRMEEGKCIPYMPLKRLSEFYGKQMKIVFE